MKRLRRILSSLLLCALLAGLSAVPVSALSDVPEDFWAKEDISRCVALGYFYPEEGGNFGVGKKMSRSEFVVVLCRALGWKPTSPARAVYSDVSEKAWYAGAVETAYHQGAITSQDGNFRPDDLITRSEAASMLVRALGYGSIAGLIQDMSLPFRDVKANNGYIIMAYGLGLMDGTSVTAFSPGGHVTREQAAAVLVRVHDQLSAASTQLSAAGDYRLITISTPIAQTGDEMPITPLEPLPELYATLRRMKTGGDDMSGAALRLMAGGVRTITDAGGSPVAGSELISAKEVQKVLENKDAAASYSERYESAYCIYAPNAYQTATVWYQSEESMAAKLQLAKLFGVTRYVLE